MTKEPELVWAQTIGTAGDTEVPLFIDAPNPVSHGDEPDEELSLTEAGESVGTRHFRGLDGIRAFAVIAVLLFHFGVNGFSGGMLGVDMFFALSGYLITSLLVAEHHRTGTIRLRNFYERRARRLVGRVEISGGTQ